MAASRCDEQQVFVCRIDASSSPLNVQTQCAMSNLHDPDVPRVSQGGVDGVVSLLHNARFICMYDRVPLNYRKYLVWTFEYFYH